MKRLLRMLGALCALPEMFSFVLLGASLSVCCFWVDDFSLGYLLSSAPEYSEIGLLALGMTLVIIAGEIDLSVAAMLTLVACVTAWLNVVFGVPYWVCLVFAPILGGGLGAFNGWVVNRFGVPSLVVTLATLALYIGLAQAIEGDTSLAIPQAYAGLDMVTVPGTEIPVPLVIFGVFAIGFYLLLHRTTFGRRIFAVGENREAAVFAGIRAKQVVMRVFVISGVLAGVGAMLCNSRYGLASYEYASGWELEVITAVLVGGAVIEGGRGTIFGTVSAMAAMMVVKLGMLLEGIEGSQELAVIGLILIVSVVNSKVMARFKR